MSSGILTLAQQPRWLLLSLFLVLWSWSTGLRRDGYSARGNALGLGVDARAAPVWQAKRQVGLPICAQQCALQAQEAIGCGDSLNLQCACHSAQFFPGAVDCMTANCTATDKQNGQDTLMTACKAVGTSVSLPTSFPTGTGTSTSITSGVPPISGSGSATTTSPSSASSSPSSGSATGTATGTGTATATATAPPSSSPSAGSSTGSGSGSGTATGTSTQGSSSTPSSTGTSGSGNGAGARGVSWPAVAVGVALAVAGAAATL